MAAKIAEMRLDQHLTLQRVESAIELADRGLKDARLLLVDCGAMPGYEAEARTRFVKFVRDLVGRVEAVAIVVKRPMYRVVVSTMSLVVPYPLRPFEGADLARAWLHSKAPDREA